jgi:ABC-type multidrug transport system fused ATPase/permease subunit
MSINLTYIQDAIEEYARSTPAGITRIAIAHRLSTIKSADLIAFVKDGAVVETGSYDVFLISIV